MININSSKKTVLIVEDNVNISTILAKRLSLLGHAIIQAYDGQNGLKLAVKYKPDLIVSDIKMPKLDGIKMLEKLRKDSWGKNARVAILTKKADANKIVQSEDLGAIGYMIKANWGINDLINRLNSYLDPSPISHSSY